MNAIVYAVLTGLAKIALVAGGVLYFGLVLMAYRTDGPSAPLTLDLSDPARSAERLLVWLGVRALDLSVKTSRALINALAEASAEVGEWFLRRRHPEVQASVRSRFMI